MKHLSAEQQALVENNMRLVTYTLKKYVTGKQWRASDIEDLFQIGCLGLCKAAAHYDPSKQTTFSTFAVRVITNQLFLYWRDINTPKRRSSAPCVSMDQAIPRQSGAPTTIGSIIKDPHANIETIAANRMLKDCLSNSQTQSSINAVLVHCLLNEITQNEAAAMLGISQAQVSRKVNKLRTEIADRVSVFFDIGGIQ